MTRHRNQLALKLTSFALIYAQVFFFAGCKPRGSRLSSDDSDNKRREQLLRITHAEYALANRGVYVKNDNALTMLIDLFDPTLYRSIDEMPTDDVRKEAASTLVKLMDKYNFDEVITSVSQSPTIEFRSTPGVMYRKANSPDAEDPARDIISAMYLTRDHVSPRDSNYRFQVCYDYLSCRATRLQIVPFLRHNPSEGSEAVTDLVHAFISDAENLAPSFYNSMMVYQAKSLRAQSYFYLETTYSDVSNGMVPRFRSRNYSNERLSGLRSLFQEQIDFAHANYFDVDNPVELSAYTLAMLENIIGDEIFVQEGGYYRGMERSEDFEGKKLSLTTAIGMIAADMVDTHLTNQALQVATKLVERDDPSPVYEEIIDSVASWNNYYLMRVAPPGHRLGPNGEISGHMHPDVARRALTENMDNGMMGPYRAQLYQALWAIHNRTPRAAEQYFTVSAEDLEAQISQLESMTPEERNQSILERVRSQSRPDYSKSSVQNFSEIDLSNALASLVLLDGQNIPSAQEIKLPNGHSISNIVFPDGLLDVFLRDRVNLPDMKRLEKELQKAYPDFHSHAFQMMDYYEKLANFEELVGADEEDGEGSEEEEGSDSQPRPRRSGFNLSDASESLTPQERSKRQESMYRVLASGLQYYCFNNKLRELGTEPAPARRYDSVHLPNFDISKDAEGKEALSPIIGCSSFIAGFYNRLGSEAPHSDVRANKCIADTGHMPLDSPDTCRGTTSAEQIREKLYTCQAAQNQYLWCQLQTIKASSLGIEIAALVAAAFLTSATFGTAGIKTFTLIGLLRVATLAATTVITRKILQSGAGLAPLYDPGKSFWENWGKEAVISFFMFATIIPVMNFSAKLATNIGRQTTIDLAYSPWRSFSKVMTQKNPYLFGATPAATAGKMASFASGRAINTGIFFGFGKIAPPLIAGIFDEPLPTEHPPLAEELASVFAFDLILSAMHLGHYRQFGRRMDRLAHLRHLQLEARFEAHVPTVKAGRRLFPNPFRFLKRNRNNDQRNNNNQATDGSRYQGASRRALVALGGGSGLVEYGQRTRSHTPPTRNPSTASRRSQVSLGGGTGLAENRFIKKASETVEQRAAEARDREPTRNAEPTETRESPANERETSQVESREVASERETRQEIAEISEKIEKSVEAGEPTETIADQAVAKAIAEMKLGEFVDMATYLAIPRAGRSGEVWTIETFRSNHQRMREIVEQEYKIRQERQDPDAQQYYDHHSRILNEFQVILDHPTAFQAYLTANARYQSFIEFGEQGKSAYDFLAKEFGGKLDVAPDGIPLSASNRQTMEARLRQLESELEARSNQTGEGGEFNIDILVESTSKVNTVELLKDAIDLLGNPQLKAQYDLTFSLEAKPVAGVVYPQ